VATTEITSSQPGYSRARRDRRPICLTRMALLRRLFVLMSATLVILLSLGVVAGYFLFTRPHVDPLAKADAIVVLGGEWDGRVDYALDLARQGIARNVVLSDSYPYHRDEMKRACDDPLPDVAIFCFTPDPFTTRGEAMHASELARIHGWTHLIVVSWNFHMVRARYIFSQCFNGTVTMRPVPRDYDEYGPASWAWTYAYQYTALVKAAIVGCPEKA
jgi:uncharacterized SAM-binding protein YcdF (DUF218 family)